MKNAWCPQTAEKSLVDTVKLCGLEGESNAAEMISAMAGGWKSRLILESWSRNCATKSISVALAIAARNSGGRHVCIVPDDESRVEYTDFMRKNEIPVPEMVVGVGRRPEFLDGLVCIDFLFIQGGDQDELLSLFGRLKLCHHGAVVAWKGVKKIYGFFEKSDLMCVVRSFALPNGLHVAYVVPKNRKKKSPPTKGKVPWIRKIDRSTGEEHIFRG